MPHCRVSPTTVTRRADLHEGPGWSRFARLGVVRPATGRCHDSRGRAGPRAGSGSDVGDRPTSASDGVRTPAGQPRPAAWRQTAGRPRCPEDSCHPGPEYGQRSEPGHVSKVLGRAERGSSPDSAIAAAGRDQVRGGPGDGFLLRLLQHGLGFEKTRLWAAGEPGAPPRPCTFLDQPGPARSSKVAADRHIRHAERWVRSLTRALPRAPMSSRNQRIGGVWRAPWTFLTPADGTGGCAADL